MNINDNNENYLTAQFEELSQRDMKKYLGEMKHTWQMGEESILMAIWIRCHIW